MISTVLEIINNEFEKLGVDYYYMTNTSGKVTYPYCTGEYSESNYSNENRESNGDLLVELWSKNGDIESLKTIEKIKEHFSEFQTVQKVLALAINFGSFVERRTGVENLKKYEMHMSVTYWKG